MARKIPLVLLHGWGVNQGVWQQLVPLLSNDFTVLTPDLPGFGTASQHFPEPYQLSTIAAQLASDIPAGSVVVGWSLGGLVATQLALDYPAQVAALGWVASSPCFLAQPGWPGMASAVIQQFASMLTRDSAIDGRTFFWPFRRWAAPPPDKISKRSSRPCWRYLCHRLMCCWQHWIF